MMFSDITDQGTLTKRANAASDDTPEILTALFDRAQRQVDVTTYDSKTDEITIALTWAAYEQHGWKQFSSTVRHELIS